jgi:lactoylglutathione lyase
VNRPFKILGVQQVAVGGLDQRALERLWVDLLGLERIGAHHSEVENVDELILRAGQGDHAVEVDLMTPVDPGRKPRVHEPPLHHVGLWVDDLDAAYAWLSTQGVRFTPGGIREGAGGHRVCFIHPKASEELPHSGEGVLIELIEAPQAD